MSLTWGAPQGGWPEFGPEGQKIEYDCRDHSDKVELTTDPFAEEIHNKQVWGYFCEECLKESAMDI